jgi:hypothetical protein
MIALFARLAAIQNVRAAHSARFATVVYPRNPFVANQLSNVTLSELKSRSHSSSLRTSSCDSDVEAILRGPNFDDMGCIQMRRSTQHRVRRTQVRGIEG